MAVLANAGEAGKGDKQMRGRKGGNKAGGDTNCFKIVKMIMERNFAPVIIFSFSKKDCELYAMQMAKLDFNTCKYGFVYYISSYLKIVFSLFMLHFIKYFIHILFNKKYFNLLIQYF